MSYRASKSTGKPFGNCSSVSFPKIGKNGLSLLRAIHGNETLRPVVSPMEPLPMFSFEPMSDLFRALGYLLLGAFFVFLMALSALAGNG